MHRANVFLFISIASFMVSTVFAADSSETVTCFNKHNQSLHEGTFDLESFTIKLSENKNGPKLAEQSELQKFAKTSFKGYCINQTKPDVESVEINIHQNETLIFEFSYISAEDNSTYRLGKILYEIRDNKSEILTSTYLNPDLKIPNNKLRTSSQGYKCGSNKYQLSGNFTVDLELTNFAFSAFRNGEKASVVECKDESGSSVIPLAVGGGLVVFMIVALVFYIFIRNRSK